MASEAIEYSDGGTALTGLLYRPSGQPRAAILVYPTIMNQSGVVLDKAASLAEHGYLAFVADLYGKNPESFEQSREFAAEIRPQPQDFRRRLRGAIRALVALPGSEGLPLGAIGFCMGGGAVLELAPRRCTAPCRGQLPRLARDRPAGRAGQSDGAHPGLPR